MLSIIIPTKDRLPILKESLNGIKNARLDFPVEVLVINDSKTKSISDLKAEYPDFSFYDNLKTGVASARNYGASIATFPFLLFIDDDIIVDGDSINYTANFLKSNEHVAINLNWVYPDRLIEKCTQNAFGRFMVKNQLTSLRGWRRDASWDTKLFEVDSGASYFLGLSVASFKKAGGYNEVFPHAGFEDFEFNKRMHGHQIRIYIEPAVTVLHNEADKLELDTWLKRNYLGAITKKTAVDLGNSEVELKMSSFKKFVYNCLRPFEFLIKGTVKLVYKIAFMDKLTFRLINILAGLNIYKGYFGKK